MAASSPNSAVAKPSSSSLVRIASSVATSACLAWASSSVSGMAPPALWAGERRRERVRANAPAPMAPTMATVLTTAVALTPEGDVPGSAAPGVIATGWTG